MGLLLWPASISSLLAAARAVGDVATAARATLPFLLGFFGYPIVHYALAQPVRLYVFGHEFTHAVAAWMSGASVLEFFVGRKGGHVDLSHSNSVIALAPYIVPIYAVFVIFAYRLLLWAVPFQGASAAHAHWSFLFLVGLMLSFHLIQTAHSLWEVKQPDLEQAGGAVFSLAVIALLNGVLLILALKCLFPGTVAAGRSLKMIWQFSLRFWRAAFAVLESSVQYVVHHSS